jgi:alpha-glucosidase
VARRHDLPGLPALLPGWRRRRVGDLPGLRRRLPYLADLGVDAVWLSPFYRSPMADFGYDVADHCDVDPLFGTLADWDALVADAHALGLRLILDFVPNHTSIEHRWWREHPERYLWRDAPNNWGERVRRLGVDVGRSARCLVRPRLPA